MENALIIEDAFLTTDTPLNAFISVDATRRRYFAFLQHGTHLQQFHMSSLSFMFMCIAKDKTKVLNNKELKCIRGVE